jgi:hypothetical protein
VYREFLVKSLRVKHRDRYRNARKTNGTEEGLLTACIDFSQGKAWIKHST